MKDRKKCCFLDRDGVVNAEVDYLYQPEKVQILPGVSEALKLLRAHDFLAIVVTNQSGVARGMYREADVKKVHDRISELLAKDGSGIDAFYSCTHHPKFTGECDCRKPAPGMLLAAMRDWNIDPEQSLMVGDRLSDVEAGRRAGCKKSYLVRCGYGEQVIAKEDVRNIPIADNLLDAVRKFLNGED